MKKKTEWIWIGAALALLAVTYFVAHLPAVTPAAVPTAQGAVDPLNATYTIDGHPIPLVNGKASLPLPAGPGSATTETVRVFGQPTIGDINGDGMPDAALILVEDGGGSGTFYYAAAAIKTATGTVGTNAIFLGDRIAPQNIQITQGQVIANYADRKPTDPMVTPPSMGVSKYLKLENGLLVANEGQ